MEGGWVYSLEPNINVFFFLFFHANKYWKRVSSLFYFTLRLLPRL
jgi:hypothetical protein